MALARVKTWNPGDVLTAADLNGEFNNVLNNPISLISPTTGVINFNLQAHTGLLPSVITASSATAGQLPVATSSGIAQWQTVSGGSAVTGLLGTLTSQTGTFQANQYVLQSSDGTRHFVLNSTASFVVNLGTAGPAANGRDQAGVFTSTYVHWYAISTGAGTVTPAGIVSSNPPITGPTLPTGYNSWVYLGASVYSSASTSLPSDHRFRGSLAFYDAALAIVTATPTSTEVAVSLSTAIPPNALSARLSGKFLNTTSTATSGHNCAVRYISNSNYYTLSFSLLSGGFGADTAMMELPNVANQFLYQIDSTANTPQVIFTAMGWKNPIGGCM